MKALDKQPTDANLDEAAVIDELDRNKFISNFIRLLSSIDGHYSIALDGRWGSGKTFFVKQTERVIKEFFNVKTITENVEINSKQKEKKNPILRKIFEKLLSLDLKKIIADHMTTFYYDAWQHDNQQDALLSLVFEIAKNATSINPQLKLKLSISDKFYKGMLEAATGIINHISGIDLAKVMNNKNEILNELQRQDNLESLLKDFFENLIPDKSSRLVIFIDELDRCKPDYAVQLLERIKHYMTFDRITFVFAVNIEQLQHTIKRYYGEDFDASSYLDRFFDLHVSLSIPIINVSRWGSKKSQFLVPWCRFLVEKMKYDLRKQCHFYRLVEHTLHTQGDIILTEPIPDQIFEYFTKKVDSFKIKGLNLIEKVKFTYSFLKCYFIPLVLALRIDNITNYYSFIDGKKKDPLDILIKHFEAYYNKEKKYNFLIDEFCSQLKLSSSYKKNCAESDLNGIVEEIYKFLFTNEYDEYGLIDSKDLFIDSDILVFSAHIKNDFEGLLSFTTIYPQYILESVTK